MSATFDPNGNLMVTGTLPPLTQRPVLPRVARRLGSVTIAAAALSAVSLLVLNHDVFQHLEAAATALVLNAGAAEPLPAMGPNFLVWTDTGRLIAVNVTLECTALIMLIPLLLLTATLALATKTHPLRLLISASAAITTVLLTNVLRLAMIGYATHIWGMNPGFAISHTFIGSVLGILGFAASITILVTTINRTHH